jgi:lipid II:glycine glycyltransferase (peptidoglycan interpeptide bridge formation enzyme)
MKESNSLLAVSVYLPGGSTCIATGMFTIAGGELALWQWAHRTSQRWYRPTELMTWRAMQQAMAVGCSSFDLMGLGPFKEKFGAAIDHTPCRWMKSRYQILARLRHVAERSYRWQQALRGRLAQRKFAGRDEAPAEPHEA